MRVDLTQKRQGQAESDFLRFSRVLAYNSETGELIWKPRERSLFPTEAAYGRFKTCHQGKTAGGNCHGYIWVRVEGAGYAAHRLAWLLYHGEWPDRIVDHINRDKKDNRIANLRLCTQQENMRNCSLSRKNTSGHTGVRRKGLKWGAYLHHGGRSVHLGLFDTREQAVLARVAGEQRYWDN